MGGKTHITKAVSIFGCCTTKTVRKSSWFRFANCPLCVRARAWGKEGGTNQWQQLTFDWTVNRCGWRGGAQQIPQEGSQSSRSCLDDSNWVRNIFLMTNRKQIVSVRQKGVPLHSTHIHPCPVRGGGQTVDVLLTAIIELSEPAERSSQDWSGRIHPSYWFFTVLLWLVTSPSL